MIRVLIVDDDYLVRMYMRQLIDWEKEGYHLLADACNGAQALKIMEQDHPEIVITDLAMPVMDGITLIQNLREQGCDAKIAVLSCHDEFDFVKEAMKQGADEYILKNLLNAAELHKLLEHLKRDLKISVEKHREQAQLRALAEKGNESLRKEAVQYLLQQELSFEKQTVYLQTHGIVYTFYQCVACFIRITQAERMKAAIEVLGQYGRDKKLLCVPLEPTLICVLMDFTGIHSEQEANQRRCASLTDIQQRLAEYTNEHAELAISACTTGDGSVTAALRQAKNALFAVFYGQSLCNATDLPPFSEQLPPLAREILRDKSHFSGEAMRDALEEIRMQNTAPPIVQDWIAALDTRYLTKQTMPKAERYVECVERVALFESEQVNEQQDAAFATENPAVAQAAAYIRAHFTEPLTLGTVAENVGLNAAYLSYVFKKETGIKFSDYVLQCRMKKVCEELKTSRIALKDVAINAGFWDYRNFCKLFRKEYGCRPADYRKQNKT